MVRIKFLVACAIVIAIPHASGALILCQFQAFGSYSCFAETIDNVTSQNEAITIEGTHIEGFGDNDVTFVNFFQSTLNYIPTQMFSIFPSTSMFQLVDSALHTLTTDAFTMCSNMQALTIWQNSFPSVPAGFAQSCFNITSIDFSNNEIKTVDKNAFTGLTILNYITLSNNNLTYLDSNTFKNTQAIEINLEYNQITTVHSDTFSGLSQLNIIELSNNKLEYLPKLNLSGSENLGYLYLRGNLIASIDPDFTFPPNSALMDWLLDLTNNTCVNGNFDQDNTFSLDKTPLCYTPRTTTVATTIDDSGTCQSDGVCRYFLDYKKRYACVIENVAYTLSSIAGVHEDGFGDQDVINLYFLNSQLVKIPSIIFEKFPNLDFLSVSETGLTVLNDDTFEECGTLKKLDASSNQIEHIKISSLLKCNSLQWLDLTGNNDLEELTPDFFKFHPNLQHVILNRIIPVLP